MHKIISPPLLILKKTSVLVLLANKAVTVITVTFFKNIYCLYTVVPLVVPLSPWHLLGCCFTVSELDERLSASSEVRNFAVFYKYFILSSKIC